jgi:hypothetical protein
MYYWRGLLEKQPRPRKQTAPKALKEHNKRLDEQSQSIIKNFKTL